MFNCIIKKARNSKNEIQWEALYVKGKKVLENYSIDIDIAISIFAPNENCKTIFVFENDFDMIQNSFPDEEDFAYLLDYTSITVGDKVWLEDGLYEVSEVYEEYRPAGEYYVVSWENGLPIKNKTYYVGHNILKFKVKGKSDYLIWEDYNQQQSYLYEYNKSREF